MELQFQKDTVSCQKMVLWEIQNQELTQEVRIPEGMPGIGRILGAWGQCVLRSKEWRHDSLTAGGGLMVWVLYEPEEGDQLEQLESWIPFQTTWDLPEDTVQGKMRINCVPRFVDARSISAGKLMLRCGVGILAEAWSPYSANIFKPMDGETKVELLQSEWPVRLPMETGEKTFHIEETLTMPPSAPRLEKIVYYRAEFPVTDKKVLGSKVVFRGSVNLHILYLAEDGQLHGWDLELPFSQFADLDRSFSGDAQVDIWVTPTGLELQLGPEGKLQFSGDLAGQYMVDERQSLMLTEDAYSPERKIEVQRQTLELPAILDSRFEYLRGEQNIPADADMVADISLMPEFPQVKHNENGVELDVPGIIQALWYGADGKIHNTQQRFRQEQSIPAASDARITATTMPMVQPGAVAGNGNITVRSELPIQVHTYAGQGLPMITGITLGEEREMDARRPSLILSRPGGRRLWDIAKENGSTMSAIRTANDFSGEPESERMLLIPVV